MYTADIESAELVAFYFKSRFSVYSGSTPTFLYFDLYLNTAYAAHYNVYFTKKLIPCVLPLRIIQHLVSYMANPSFGPKQCFFSATIIRFHEFKEKRKIILDLCADCAPVLMACEAHDRLLSEIDFDSSPVSAFE